jgi:hypothetical protein
MCCTLAGRRAAAEDRVVRTWRWFFGVAAVAAACDLNPQPLPPELTSEDGGFGGGADGATTTPVEVPDGGTGGGMCDATVCSNGVDAGHAADAAEDSAPVPFDAASDGTDGGEDAGADAHEDAGDAMWDATLD